MWGVSRNPRTSNGVSVADAFGLGAAVWAIAAVTLASGVGAAVRMTETLPVSRGRNNSTTPGPQRPAVAFGGEL